MNLRRATVAHTQNVFRIFVGEIRVGDDSACSHASSAAFSRSAASRNLRANEVIVVVVFTLKAVPISTQYFLTSVLVQLTRTPSVVTG